MTGTDGSVPAKSGHNQTAVTDTLRDDFESPQFGGLGGGLIALVTSFITSGIQAILGGFDNVIDAVLGGIGDFIEALIDLLDFIPGVGSGLERLANGLNDSHSTAQEAHAVATSSGLVVQTVRTQVVALADGIPIRPAWESMNPTENSTFPRDLLMQLYWRVKTGSTENVTGTGGSGDGSHNHTLTPIKDATFTPAVNAVEAGYIMSTYSGGRATISFIADGVTSPCELYVVLGRMDADGDVLIEWVSANQTPLMGIARSEHTVTLPAEVPFEPGEYIVAMIHQRGSGNARPLMGLVMSDIPRPGAIHPPQQKMHITTSSVLTAGTTIAKASQVFTSRNLPWIGVGKVLYTGDPPPRVLFDDFDRANNGDIGPLWAKISEHKPMILDNTFAYASGFPSDGTAYALYGTQLAYDSQRIQSELGGSMSSRDQAILFRYNASGTIGMALWIDSGTAWLARRSGGSWTTLSSIPISNIAGDVWRVDCGLNESDQWTYVASCQEDGAGPFIDRLSWTDTAGVVPVGIGYRYAGLAVSRDSFTNSGGWRWIRAEDLVMEAA